MKDQVTSLQQQQQQLGDNNQHLRIENKSLDDEAYRHRCAAESLDEEGKDLSRRHELLLAERESMDEQVVSLQEQQESLEYQLAEATRDYEYSEDEVKDLEKEIKDLKKEHDARIDAIRAAIGDLRIYVSSVVRSKYDYCRSLKKAEASNQSLQVENSDLKFEIEGLKARLALHEKTHVDKPRSKDECDLKSIQEVSHQSDRS